MQSCCNLRRITRAPLIVPQMVPVLALPFPDFLSIRAEEHIYICNLTDCTKLRMAQTKTSARIKQIE